VTERILAGRYRLLRALGRGGMGQVHEAQDMTLGRRVAVKILATDGSAPHDPAMLERFRREAPALARVNSAGVVQVLDAGEEDGSPFLVMELLDGVELQTLIAREGPLPVQVVEIVAAAVSAGLTAVHEAGVVHRDVKPSNVMITQSGRVVLQDFGLARAVDSSAITQLGTLVGTPQYIPPETVRGGPHEGVSDLYGLGLCMYAMLTGEGPFADESELGGIVLSVVDVGVPRLTGAEHIPEALAELVDSLSARDPAARPQSAAEVLRRLPLPSAQGEQLLREMVARSVRDQAVATVSGSAGIDSSLPEYDFGPPFLPPPSGIQLSAAQQPLHLSDATRQIVLSGMTAQTAASRQREAVTLVMRGELQEALRMLTAVVQVCSTALGQDHPTTLTGKYWQAVCLARLGAGRDAIALFSAVSEHCEPAKGPVRD
jgi:serine/threonine protein kinase